MDEGSKILGLTADVVAAYVRRNSIPAADLPKLISEVFGALSRANSPAQRNDQVAKQTPAVPVRRSVTDEAIICLEDGLKLQTLKRHLQTAHGLTVGQYRLKWDLPPDYPVVTKTFAERRSSIAKQIGLGKTNHSRRTKLKRS